MNKNELRQNNIKLRKSLNRETASNCIIHKLENMELFLNSKNILIFYPLKYEINLLSLLNYKNKNFYLPKVHNDNLLICPYTNNLKKSSFGVMEPQSLPINDISKIDICFTPALAIDKYLNRLGYGKGFYDRLFLNSNFKAKKIAVIQKELVVQKIETDSFDVKVDMIITN